MDTRVLRCSALLLSCSLVGCSQRPWRQRLQSEDPIQRIRGAVGAGQSRDPSALPLLVDRLEDDDEAVRMYAILALQRIEGTTLGYKYWAEPQDLTHMAQRWRNYLKNRTGRAVAATQPAAPMHPSSQPAPHRQAGLPDHHAPPMERTPSTQPLAQEAYP